MYLDMIVDIPNEPNKITYRCKSNVDYVYYEYSRIYDKKQSLQTQNGQQLESV